MIDQAETLTARQRRRQIGGAASAGAFLTAPMGAWTASELIAGSEHTSASPWPLLVTLLPLTAFACCLMSEQRRWPSHFALCAAFALGWLVSDTAIILFWLYVAGEPASGFDGARSLSGTLPSSVALYVGFAAVEATVFWALGSVFLFLRNGFLWPMQRVESPTHWQQRVLLWMTKPKILLCALTIIATETVTCWLLRRTA